MAHFPTNYFYLFFKYYIFSNLRYILYILNLARKLYCQTWYYFATMSKYINWRSLLCSDKELQLKATLLGGQSFRWKQIGTNGDEYLGVMGNIIWLLKQTATHLNYQIVDELPYGDCEDDVEDSTLLEIRMKVAKPKGTSKKKDLLYPEEYYTSILKKYFRLDVNLEEEYKSWSKAHLHFKTATNGKFSAIRVLDQDPVENVFSFICSQNNNIDRISSMVERLCIFYGKKIGEYNGESYYSFPNVHQLSDPEVESNLRENRFGYRAKFIQKCAEQIKEKGNLLWLKELQQLGYKEAHQELIKLCGIGPKVADCICLMSLRHLESIPVDTHIYQIAQKHYMKELKSVKTLSAKLYNEIGDKFRDVYGKNAGWAQTVLFCSDLKKFQDEEKSEKKASKRKAC